MTNISSKQVLNRQIKDCLWDESPASFPVSFTFCEGLGHPTFRITVERLQDDFYIDSSGNKWVRVKDQEEK